MPVADANARVDASTFGNTQNSYGLVTRTFHWLTALLIVSAFVLGAIAYDLPYDTGEQLAWKAQLFSLHKTVGISAFVVALARILWALTQPKPAAMHPERRAETFLAETVHWLLYASMAIVPLTGWIHHAATEGFAPILWPFGQGFPLVPKSPVVAEIFGETHKLFTKILAASIFLHAAGAIKHAVVDHDGTLARMCFGTDKTAPMRDHKSRAPIFAALGIYVIGAGASLALVETFQDDTPAATVALAEVASDWQVTEGALGISVNQFGSDVAGSFAEWTAAIAFQEEAVDGKHGDVTVEIAIPTLTLGSVTSDALGADFFNAAEFPTATFKADILPAETGYVADGTLTLRGVEVPVSLAFALEIDGDTAQMTGTTALDRRDFKMGESYPDESSVGFNVAVNVALTATRAAASE